MTSDEVSGNVVAVFTEKLSAFAESLSPAEASLLATILTRADDSEDVEGHWLVGPEIADPALRLAHLYTTVAWYEFQPHLQSLIQHILAGGHIPGNVAPHVQPHLPPGT